MIQTEKIIKGYSEKKKIIKVDSEKDIQDIIEIIIQALKAKEKLEYLIYYDKSKIWIEIFINILDKVIFRMYVAWNWWNDLNELFYPNNIKWIKSYSLSQPNLKKELENEFFSLYKDINN